MRCRDQGGLASLAWCCLVKAKFRLVSSRPQRQSPLKFSARICAPHPVAVSTILYSYVCIERAASRSTDLCASVRSQVLAPLAHDLEPSAVPRMHELVRERVLHVTLAHEPVLAQEDAERGREAAGERGRARLAADGQRQVRRRRRVGRRGVGWVGWKEGEVLEHEADDRACGRRNEGRQDERVQRLSRRAGRSMWCEAVKGSAGVRTDSRV